MKTLKQLKFILILIVSISFVACSGDDDDNQPTNAELLANKWYLIKQVNNSTSPATEEIADDCERNTYFDFNDDGTVVAESFGLNGADCESFGIEAANYTYDEDLNQIVIYEGTDSTIVTINTLTQTELVFTSSSLTYHFDR